MGAQGRAALIAIAIHRRDAGRLLGGFLKVGPKHPPSGPNYHLGLPDAPSASPWRATPYMRWTRRPAL